MYWLIIVFTVNNNPAIDPSGARLEESYVSMHPQRDVGTCLSGASRAIDVLKERYDVIGFRLESTACVYKKDVSL